MSSSLSFPLWFEAKICCKKFIVSATIVLYPVYCFAVIGRAIWTDFRHVSLLLNCSRSVIYSLSFSFHHIFLSLFFLRGLLSYCILIFNSLLSYIWCFILFFPSFKQLMKINYVTTQQIYGFKYFCHLQWFVSLFLLCVNYKRPRDIDSMGSVWQAASRNLCKNHSHMKKKTTCSSLF